MEGIIWLAVIGLVIAALVKFVFGGNSGPSKTERKEEQKRSDDSARLAKAAAAIRNRHKRLGGPLKEWTDAEIINYLDGYARNTRTEKSMLDAGFRPDDLSDAKDIRKDTQVEQNFNAFANLFLIVVFILFLVWIGNA